MSEEKKDGPYIEHGCMCFRHRGYELRYSDNEDVWRCHKLNLEHKSLNKAKELINKIDADARKLDAGVALIYLSTSGIEPVTATMIDLDGKGVWVNQMTTSAKYPFKKTVERRQKHSREALVLDTPENRELIEAARVKRTAGYALIKEADAMFKAVPRIRLDQLQKINNLPPAEKS